MKKSEQQLRLITDNVHELIAYVDREQRYQYVNDRYTQAVGLRREEIIGRRCKGVLGPSAYDSIRKHMELALAGQPQHFETSFETKSGETVWREAACIPDFGDGGQVRGFYALVIDATERKRSEAERRTLEEQLRQAQKLGAIGTLAAGIAHDFSSLLMAIRVNTEAARRTLADESPAMVPLRGIEEASLQAADLTKSLLAFSRKTGSTKVPVDICRVIAGSVRMLRHMLPHAIEILTDFPHSGDVWVNANATQLQQVMMNLSMNARDAMPQGGKLRITVEPVTVDSSGDLTAVSLGRRALRWVVEDEGIGMSKATVERIFDPFFTTKTRERGTGLGMAIVYGIRPRPRRYPSGAIGRRARNVRADHLAPL